MITSRDVARRIQGRFGFPDEFLGEVTAWVDAHAKARVAKERDMCAGAASWIMRALADAGAPDHAAGARKVLEAIEARGE